MMYTTTRGETLSVADIIYKKGDRAHCAVAFAYLWWREDYSSPVTFFQ